MENNQSQSIETPPLSPDTLLSGPQSAPSPKQSHLLRIFFIALALIIFGILVGVLVARFLPMSKSSTVSEITPTETITEAITSVPLETPTSTFDETANWKVYTDAKYGYTLKYPTTGIINTTNYTGYLSSIEISHLAPNTDFELIDIYVGNKCNGEGNKPTITNINGLSVTRSSYPMGQNPAAEFACLQYQGKYYSINLTWGEGTDNNLLNIYTQILSTFKFTEQKPLVGLKTYSNSQYHFSVDYPSNWTLENNSQTGSSLPYLINKTNGYSISFLHLKDEPGKIREFDGKEMVFDTTNQKLININGVTAYVKEKFQGVDGIYTSYTFKISQGEYIQLLTPITNDIESKKYNQEEIDKAIQIAYSFKLSK